MSGPYHVLTVYNGNLIAGCDFNGIASWDGTGWSALGSGVNYSVLSLTVYNGNLIAGGNFTIAGNKVSAYLAQWAKGSSFMVSGYAYWMNAGGRIPIPNRIVQLSASGKGFLKEDTTDANGLFSFSSVPRDDYCIKVIPRAECVYDISATLFDTLSGPGVTGLNINFVGGPDGAPTEVEEVDSREIPEHFALGQNFPNPFNLETAIQFSVARTADVKLDILNVFGQTARTIVDEVMPVGVYRATWDGRNEHGEEVASGVYLYRLTAGSSVITRKMVLLK